MLENILRSLAEPCRRWLGEKFLDCALIAGSVGFAIVGAAFATLSAFAFLQGEFTRIEAALIVAAFYLALAAIWPLWRLFRRVPVSNEPVTSADTAKLDEALSAICRTGAIDDPAALAAISQFARTLSPFQVLSIAVVGGFIAGRKLRR